MKRALYGIWLRTKSLMRSFRIAHKIHLMDDVIYDGKLCFVNNGISAPIWDLCEKALKEDGTRNTYRVHEDDFRKIFSLWNIKNGLFSLHQWYMDYWYEIHLRDKFGC